MILQTVPYLKQYYWHGRDIKDKMKMQQEEAGKLERGRFLKKRKKEGHVAAGYYVNDCASLITVDVICRRGPVE